MLGSKAHRGEGLFEDMIAQKINGTYVEETIDKRPKYNLTREECLPDRRYGVNPLMYAEFNSLNGNQGGSVDDDKPRKNFGRRNLISSRLDRKIRAERRGKKNKYRFKKFRDVEDCSFCNFGSGNTTRLNRRFNYTTYNVTAGDGINPNTLIRLDARKNIENISAPSNESKVVVHKPAVFKSISDAPVGLKHQLKGPIYVSWPKDEPVPKEYALIRNVIEN